MSLTLKNPHSVIAALQTRPLDVLEVRAGGSAGGDAWKRVVELAREAGVAVSPMHGVQRGRKNSAGRTAATEAVVKPRDASPLRSVLQSEGIDRGLWLALDRLQDPHNVGAVFRTAAFYGVRGVVLTTNRSAPLSSTVYDVAAGGIEHVPFCIESNLRHALHVAKEAGLWVLGTSEHAGRNLEDVDPDRNWLLVVGNEERGCRRLTLETCDETCRLTPRGAVTSLNVSVAAGVCIARLAPDAAS